MDKRPIGIFDSGYGGLTVMKEVIKKLPNENIIYFGDNGRAPYGTKSKDTIIKYTLEDINFLLYKDVKAIVIACNTASANAFYVAKDKFRVPIIEVIEPNIELAISKTKNKRIGIIGTSATISNGIYERDIKHIDDSINVFSKACPLFVNLVEEGWVNHKVTRDVAVEYLNEFKKHKIDTLILGCTHYPLLKKVITDVLGKEVKLLNSGEEVANRLKSILESENIQNSVKNNPKYEFYTSDSVKKFTEMGKIFLGKNVDGVEKINIGEF